MLFMSNAYTKIVENEEQSHRKDTLLIHMFITKNPPCFFQIQLTTLLIVVSLVAKGGN